MDREKIIKALEHCKDNQYVNDCNKCDYGGKTGMFCIRMIDDAIAMLKEREPKKVKDKSTRIEFLDEYFEGECPSCRSFIDEHSNRNFCGYCGQAVKWERQTKNGLQRFQRKHGGMLSISIENILLSL